MMRFFSRKTASYLSDPDVQMMLAFKNGDNAAFEALMRKHYRSVLNFIARFTGRPAGAEDLAQEVFLRIYRSKLRYSPKARFRTWMFTIAKNLSLNEIRRVANAGDRLRGGESDSRGIDVPDHPDLSAPAAEELLLAQERSQMLLRAIDSLPDNQRSAVLLRRFEDLSYAEIATVLGVSQKAVKSLLNRAKVNLRRRLENIIDL